MINIGQTGRVLHSSGLTRKLGNRVSLSISAILAVGLMLGLAFVYAYEKNRLNELIHDKASRVLLALEAGHTQAMIHRGHKSDDNPVIKALNGTMSYLSETQDRMDIWLIMGPKVVDFQVRTRSNEIERPTDDVDREAIETGESVGRFISDNIYRLTKPVVLGRGPGSNQACFTCHGADMGIQVGEPIGGYSIAYDATEDFNAFSLFLLETAGYLTALILFIAIVIVVVINRNVSRPIDNIADVMKRITEGDNEVRPPNPTTANSIEIEEILRAVNVFNEYARSKTDLLRHAIDEHAIVSITDVKGRITYANDRFCMISEYSREELVGQNHRILKSNEHPPALYEDLWKTISNGDVWRGEIKNRKKNGGYYWVDATIVPFLNDKGVPAEYIGLRTDITRQKEEEASFRSLASVSPAGIFRTDVDGNVTYVNEKWCELGGLTSDESMGDGWINALHKDDMPATMEKWRQYVDGVCEFRQEQRYVKKDGTVTECISQVIPERDENGAIIGHIGVITDITDQKINENALIEAQDQLQAYVFGLEDAQQRIEEEAAKQIALSEDLAIARDEAEAATSAKSEFLASMSHEIRTPMTGVMGFADLLLEDNLETDSKEKVYKIKDATRSLLRIINDILDISKMEAGKVELENIDFHLPTALNDVIDLFSEKRKGERAKAVKFELTLSDEFPEGANSDPTRLRQILVNLIGNAKKFTEDGFIKIQGSVEHLEQQDFIRISVSDTGIGMQPETISKLFTEFTQADASITRRFEGTGLGLSICKRLVDLMGGEIGAESQYGEGSTFWFRLPYTPATAEVRTSAVGESVVARNYKAVRPLRILIVDDNELNQQIIFATIIGFGHTATIVENGMEAIEKHAEGEFDLILMDVRMPVMSGPDATRVIRKMGAPKSNIPIIALTADAMEEHKQGYYEAGMDEVVTKPINRAELALSINSVMKEEIHLPVADAEDGTEMTLQPVDGRVSSDVDAFLKNIGVAPADETQS